MAIGNFPQSVHGKPILDTMQVSRGKLDCLPRKLPDIHVRLLVHAGSDSYVAFPSLHASYPVLVHQFTLLLHASFRPSLTEGALALR